MSNLTRPIAFVLLSCLMFFAYNSYAQSVLNPSDTIVNYNPATPPTLPPYGTIGKWVRTPRLNWNTNEYKCYTYNGSVFRLKFPKTYNPLANDGKKYPMLIFFHGLGEGSKTPYDNEYQLYHGGQFFMNSVDNGTFDGYVLALQTGGSWGVTEYNNIRQLIDYMITNNKLDPFHIVNNGLSAGGQGTWEMYTNNPTYIASIMPMSSVYSAYAQSSFVNAVKFTPIWMCHGGLDGAPAPSTAEQVNTAMQAQGANYTDLLYPTLGHGTWDQFWTEPNFWPFIKNSYMSNPWTLFGRTQFCPGDPINVTVGLVNGFDEYQFRKNGTIIQDGSSNTINVTSLGTYDARVRRGTLWSDWSHTPVVIAIKPPTVTPNINVVGTMSNVIPALDGNKGVTLGIPAGYASYTWQKIGNSSTISTVDTLIASTPGQYQVQVTEKFGCSSNFSNPFTVVDANGPNKPDPASGLVAGILSKTSLRLNWSENPTPQYQETKFEIYQGIQSGGPYTLIGFANQNVDSFIVNNLHPNTNYFYKVRAVNNSGASAASNEAKGTTFADIQPPTAPPGLTILGTTRSSVSLSWGTSTDDVGVTQYQVFINNNLSYVTTNTNFIVTGLVYGNIYNIKVRAMDFAGNGSAFSNQVTAQAINNGLTYKYFEGSWTVLPDFNALTPVNTGFVSNYDLTPRKVNTYFGFLYEGYINIPVSGTYTFRLNSDDGSKLYLGAKDQITPVYNYSATAKVNFDGLHGPGNVNSQPISLQAGTYPIAVAYFQQGGGLNLNVYYSGPQTAGSFVAIPNSYFQDAVPVNGTAPADPSGLVASSVNYRQINLNWTDNSNNENGFTIFRSLNQKTGYNAIGAAPSGATSYSDTTAASNTTYYYQLQAFGQYGQSAIVSSGAVTDANWKFNNSYADSSINSRSLSSTGSPAFTGADKMEGGYSLILNGSSQYVTINTAAGDYLRGGYNKKTLAFWMKVPIAANLAKDMVIMDLGGSDNGLAVRIVSNTLYAGVSSGSVSQSVSIPYNSTSWNHIAVVYNSNSLQLYLNGSLVASNSSLPFSSVGTTTDGSRIGQVNGTNALAAGTGYFAGLIDNVGIYNSALSSADINSIINTSKIPQSWATTSVLPPVAPAPTNLVASAVSPTQVNLSWVDNAINETSYQVFRSNNTNTNYVLLTTLAPNTTSYSDNGLFANAIYYYKVRAVNVGGNSNFSNESNSTTFDIAPTIVQLKDTTARYGATTVINISASDPNGDALSFSASNLPSFATITDNGNKTATLTLNPTIANNNITYSNIIITVNDQHGGSTSTQFNLTVNDNYAPVVAAISNYSVNEGQSLTIPLTATDQNSSDILTWSVSNVPNNFTLTPGTNGNATLQLNPTYAAAGSYVVSVSVSDGRGGISTKQFNLSVINQDPSRKIYVRFQDQTPVAAPWNNVTSANTTGLKDQFNVNTNINLQFVTNWYSTWHEGATTGNNSGIYSDTVSKEYYYFGSYPGIFTGPNTVIAKLTGLDGTKKYSISFYSASSWSVQSNNGTTTFTINGITQSLAVQNNTSNVASFNNLVPASDGTITFTLGLGANTPVGYLNAIVINTQYDDGNPPAGPKNLIAQNVPNLGVQLNWQDAAFNATGYQVFRTQDTTQAFSLIATRGPSDTTYVDAAANGNTKFYYKVNAINTHGQSGYTNVAGIVTGNRVPAINSISNVVMNNNQQTTLNVSAVDDPTDHITLTQTGLPPFATLQDNGDGTGVITVTPNGVIGTYLGVTITATDSYGASSSTTFDLSVVDNLVVSTYVNFTDGVTLGPKPWNNFTAQPFAGASLTNLVDDRNNQTGYNVTLQDGFQWYIASGMRPHNGMTIYPESVVRTALFDSSSVGKRVVISGLSNTKRYNFVFFNSHEDGFKGLTKFTIGLQSDTLNATYNINKTAQINGVSPDQNGQVTITVSKIPGQDFAYFTSLIIQSYDITTTLLSPINLRVIDTKRTTTTLQWEDRSFDETGFEVLQATSPNGTYSSIATLPAGSTNYTITGLNPNTTYYYTVRALLGPNHSSSSNAVAASTLAYAVYLNYTASNDAPLPWNNTDAQPQLGYVWNNFHDENGAISSIGEVITNDFAGIYGAGMNTGNNSGIYPDNVLKDNYGVFPGQSATYKLTGLNLSMKYNLTFMASSFEQGDFNNAYIINGDTVMLNASLNTYGTVTKYGVSPDQNGEIYITVAPGTPAALYGLVASMVIQAYNPPPTNDVPAPPLNQIASQLRNNRLVNEEAIKPENDNISVYPNPFNKYFTLSVPAQNNDVIKVLIYDMGGRLLYNKQFTNLNKGTNFLRIENNNDLMRSGTYLIKILFPERPASSKGVMIVKQ